MRVVGWNLVFLGKYDCTLFGALLAWCHSHSFVLGDNTYSNGSISEYLRFGFSKNNIEGIEDKDTRVFFQNRLTRKGSVLAWFEDRIGRVADRSKWRNLKFDHRKNKAK